MIKSCKGVFYIGLTEWVLANQNEPRRCEEDFIHHEIWVI
jgi:hypothetical protein